MNDGLIDLLGHNSWATRELLQMSRGLSDDELETTVTGVYGNIIETFRHIIGSEAWYQRRLTGDEPSWLQGDADSPGIDELLQRNDDLAARWERLLEEPFDAERAHVYEWHDGTQRDVPSGVVIAQAIHHGSDHRSQICTVLTTLGMTIPAMGLWDYAEATGRAALRDAVDSASEE